MSMRDHTSSGVMMGNGDTGITVSDTVWENPAESIEWKWKRESIVGVDPAVVTSTFPGATVEMVLISIALLTLKEKLELFDKFSDQIDEEMSLLKRIETKLEKKKEKKKSKKKGGKKEFDFLTELQKM